MVTITTRWTSSCSQRSHSCPNACIRAMTRLAPLDNDMIAAGMTFLVFRLAVATLAASFFAFFALSEGAELISR